MTNSAVKCPICKSDASLLDKLIDGDGFGCPTHVIESSSSLRTAAGETHWDAGRPLAALVLAALLLVAPNKAHGEEIPAEFWGGWCDTVPGQALNSVDPEKYTRSSARACPADRIWIAINSDGYRTAPSRTSDGHRKHEAECKVVNGTADRKGNFLVAFRCSNVPDTGQHWRLNYWMSLIGKHLVLRLTEREP